jgi:hypothetical protein
VELIPKVALVRFTIQFEDQMTPAIPKTNSTKFRKPLATLQDLPQFRPTIGRFIEIPVHKP